jgi:TolA-binding protein
VRAKYPLSTWSDAAGYRIGQCLEMLGRTAQAEQHWTAFAAGAPAGRWRGQARVGLVHLALVARGDLKAAAQQAAAAHKILTAGVDEPAAATWNHAAMEIHLSRGIVALLEARHADAAAALRDACDTATAQERPARFLAGLHRLITAAERREEVIPARLALPDERFRLTLSVGTIDNLLGRFEQAGRAFDHVLGSPMRLALQPHRSFAALGKARAIVGVARDDDSAADDALTAAKAAYLLSLSALPDAPWHEHALRELALLIEDLAGRSREPSGTKVAGTRRVPSGPTPDSARAALEAARCEALPHWQALLDRFPESPHVPQALYHAGVLHAEGAKPSPERSVAAFEQLTKQFPASPWTGDAHVRLIDVKLERQFDLPSAALHARAAADWLAGRSREPSGPDPAAAPPSSSPFPPAGERPGAPSSSPRPPGEGPGVRASATASDGTQPPLSTLLLDDLFSLSLPSLDRTSYAIYLRAGLVAYLSERPAEAVEWFERAKPFEPERSFVVVHGHIPTGIERLIDVAKSGKTVTPEEARRGDERARLILMLADVFLESSVHEKALELATAVIDKPKGAATPAQRSWAHRQRAVAYGHLGPEVKEDARREYMAAQQAGPTAPWAPECLLVAGTILHNHETRRQEAVAVFEDVVRRYPASESAAKAAYFVGVLHEWNSEWKQAKAAYQRVVRDYPQSRWASAAMNYHLKKVEAALAAQETGR